MPVMDEIVINGHDVSRLFDLSLPGIPFAAPRINNIPEFGSIIYTVWHNELGFIYVGIGGLGRGPDAPMKKRNPRSRIEQHFSGRRSGDQFCIYIQDFFVIPEIMKSGTYEPERGLLDKLTKKYIHSHLAYRFVCFQTDDSSRIVRELEKKIQRGVLGFSPPLLNGIRE